MPPPLPAMTPHDLKSSISEWSKMTFKSLSPFRMTPVHTQTPYIVEREHLDRKYDFLERQVLKTVVYIMEWGDTIKLTLQTLDLYFELLK